MLGMVASIGAATAYSMANATGDEQEREPSTPTRRQVQGNRSESIVQMDSQRTRFAKPTLMAWISPCQSAKGCTRNILRRNCGDYRLLQEAAVVEVAAVDGGTRGVLRPAGTGARDQRTRAARQNRETW
ncbi:unnamed protein product [Ectocarpus sp. 12 AP-2014]